jgi:hypothetical protein
MQRAPPTRKSTGLSFHGRIATGVAPPSPAEPNTIVLPGDFASFDERLQFLEAHAPGLSASSFAALHPFPYRTRRLNTWG